MQCNVTCRYRDDEVARIRTGRGAMTAPIGSNGRGCRSRPRCARGTTTDRGRADDERRASRAEERAKGADGGGVGGVIAATAAAVVAAAVVGRAERLDSMRVEF